MNAENSERTAKPRGRPFKKGTSGNPGGRPRLTAEVRQLCRDASPGAVERLIKLARSHSPPVALRAIGMLLDRAWGAPGSEADVRALDTEEERERARDRELTAEQLISIRDRAQELLDAKQSAPRLTPAEEDAQFRKAIGAPGSGAT